MLTIVLIIIISLLIILCIVLLSRIGSISQSFRDSYQKNLQTAISQEKELAKREAEVSLKEWIQKSEKLIREDAVKRSRSSTVGRLTEHFLPYIGQFPYNPKDVKHVGQPFDLLVIDGMDEGHIKEIIFLEVKTGKFAQLTSRERQIRDVIKNGKVKWKEFRVDRNDDLETL